MYAHLVIILAKEKDMVAENECYHLIEFQDCVETPYKEPAERVEFLKVIKDYFIVI